MLFHHEIYNPCYSGGLEKLLERIEEEKPNYYLHSIIPVHQYETVVVFAFDEIANIIFWDDDHKLIIKKEQTK